MTVIKTKYPIPTHVFDPSREEIYETSGDMDSSVMGGPLPTADRTDVGIQGTHHLDRMGENNIMIRESDKVTQTVDIYLAPAGPGEKPEVTVHMYCPRCRNSIKISSKDKPLSFDPKTGRLDIEPVGCPWELDPNTPTNKGLSISSLCRARFAIEYNVLRMEN